MRRQIYLACGAAAFTLAMIGIVLPIMPTVPFLLLAAFCFSRSHPALAARLYEHPRYGPAMRQWRDRGAVSRRAKISAVLAMSAGVVFTWFSLGWPWVMISLAVLMLAGAWLWSRPE